MTTRILSTKKISNTKLTLAAFLAVVALALAFGSSGCAFDDDSRDPTNTPAVSGGDFHVSDVNPIPAQPTAPAESICAPRDRTLPFTPYRPPIEGQTNVAKSASAAWQVLDARMTGIVRWFDHIGILGPYGEWDALKPCVFGCDLDDKEVHQAVVDSRGYVAECRSETIREADVRAILAMGKNISEADIDGFLVKWMIAQAIE